MMETRTGKLKLVDLAISLVGSKILCVPKPIFKRIYIEDQLETVCKAYEHFMLKVNMLEVNESFDSLPQGALPHLFSQTPTNYSKQFKVKI